MKAFASMYLNEPHSATKSYGSLKQKVGKDMFIKGHRMEPYYAAALASYHVDFMFRNGRIDPKYKTARYHIIMAIRLREAGYKMPHMSANQMEKYCKKLIDRLANDPEGVIAGAVSSITEVSGGNMDRENIRTEAFTKDVISSLPSSA